MNTYAYDGAVMRFDICIDRKWAATTTAVTEARAKSNLVYRYKKEHGLEASAKITLPDNLKIV